MNAWNISDIPPQNGRLAVITGATGGIGYEAALALAEPAGANVVLTGRNAKKGEAARQRIISMHPGTAVRYAELDLASLRSVAEFADRFCREHDGLDLLINNGGVMMPPTRHVTQDAFELRFGTNHVGHFALTARLLPVLRRGQSARVVTVSSLAHRLGAEIHFDDLQWERRYKPWLAYAQSKLATLIFAFELQRRSEANGWGLMSNACHPGYAVTGLQSAGPRLGLTRRPLLEPLGKVLFEPWASHSAAAGALPTLFAAASPDAKPAGYYGPQSLFEMKGNVGEAKIGKRARDTAVATRLWEVSEQLTGAVLALSQIGPFNFI